MSEDQEMTEVKLTALAHGGGCGCKIAPDVLRGLLAQAPAGLPLPEALMIGAATSDDAAVYRLSGSQALVATTDFFMPVVDDPFDFGRIAATNALSDVFAMGARPIFSLAVVGMPVGKIGPEVIGRILAGGQSVAEEAGAPVAGGHSIDSVEPIYGLVALGLADPQRLLTNAGAKPGDALILGKPLGIGIFSAALKQGKLSADGYGTMLASTTLLNRPGAALAELDGVHAGTDVTGFGLLGHLMEMCMASGLAAEIEAQAVPVFPEAQALAAEGVRTGASGRNWGSLSDRVRFSAAEGEAMRDLLCDPQTSGGLLIACAPEAANAVLDIFQRHGHAGARLIGRMSEGAPSIDVI